MKFALKHLNVQNPPEQPNQLLVRPEVSGINDLYEDDLRLCSVLFGDVGRSLASHRCFEKDVQVGERCLKSA